MEMQKSYGNLTDLDLATCTCTADFNLHMHAVVPKSPEEALSEDGVVGFFFTCLSSV